MTNAFIAALLLNFGAATGAIVTRTGSHQFSDVTHRVAPFLVPLATLAGFGAIALFIYDQGLGYGLLSWALSAIAFVAVATVLGGMAKGLVSWLGMLALVAGAIMGVFVFV